MWPFDGKHSSFVKDLAFRDIRPTARVSTLHRLPSLFQKLLKYSTDIILFFCTFVYFHLMSIFCSFVCFVWCVTIERWRVISIDLTFRRFISPQIFVVPLFAFDESLTKVLFFFVFRWRVQRIICIFFSFCCVALSIGSCKTFKGWSDQTK